MQLCCLFSTLRAEHLEQQKKPGLVSAAMDAQVPTGNMMLKSLMPCQDQAEGGLKFECLVHPCCCADEHLTPSEPVPIGWVPSALWESSLRRLSQFSFYIGSFGLHSLSIKVRETNTCKDIGTLLRLKQAAAKRRQVPSESKARPLCPTSIHVWNSDSAMVLLI